MTIGGYGKSVLIMSSSSATANHTPKTSTEAKSNKKSKNNGNGSSSSSSGSKSKTKNSNTSGGSGGGGNGNEKTGSEKTGNEKSTGGGGIFKPLVVLALPGVNLFRRFSQYRRLPQEPPKDKLEVELERLNSKIVSEFFFFFLNFNFFLG